MTMRVVVVTNVYPNKYGWADGIFVAEQVRMLEHAGCKADVLYIDLRSFRKRRKWGEETYQDGKSKVYHYSLPCGPIPVIHDVLYLAVMKYALKKYLKKGNKPDIVHGHFYMNGVLAKNVRKKYGVPYVLTEHSSELYREKISKLHQHLMKKSYNGVDCLIGVSNALKRQMEKYVSRNIEVVPNVLMPQFQYMQKEDNASKDFVFISVGHIIKSKGMKLLVESFEQVQAKIPQVKLVIAGEGALRQELEDYVKSKNINVRFLGEIEHEKMPEAYSKSKCFVLPSEKETFGVSYIEAMACGLPVIATKCGGPEEFVNAKNGVLIPVNDSAGLINAMLFMYENCNAFDGLQISQDILSRYGAEHVVKRIVEIYNKCLDR